MNGYLWYALAFSLLPYVICSPVVIMRSISVSQKYVYTVQSTALFLLHIIYIPVSLAVFRLYYCDQGVLSADPQIQCSATGKYAILTSLSTILVSPLIVGLPIISRRYIQDVVVYQHKYDHEKRIQVWEITYGLGLDDFWLRSYIWLTSSFSRVGCYFRCWMLVFKLGLAVIFIFVRGAGVGVQSTLFFGWTLCFGIVCIKTRPFRSVSSNAIMCILISLLITASCFGVMNSVGTRNALTVGSKESMFLLALFCLGLLFIIAICGMSYFVIKDDWPSILTISRINAGSTRHLVLKWISAISEAGAIRADLCGVPVEIADLTDLNRIILVLRKSWLAARSNGSLFEVILGDVLDNLLLYHMAVAPKSLLNNRLYLKEALTNSAASIAFREKSTILMSRKKRRVLTKMTALRAFIGNKLNSDVMTAPVNSFTDWGQELDRVKYLLANIPHNIVLTNKAVHKDRDISEWKNKMDEILEVCNFWDELIAQIESGQISQVHIPPGIQIEDFYTYRRLMHDFSVMIYENTSDYGDDNLEYDNDDDDP